MNCQAFHVEELSRFLNLLLANVSVLMAAVDIVEFPVVLEKASAKFIALYVVGLVRRPHVVASFF